MKPTNKDVRDAFRDGVLSGKATLKEKKAELLKEIDKIKISHQWDERIKIVFLEDLKKKVEEIMQ